MDGGEGDNWTDFWGEHDKLENGELGGRLQSFCKDKDVLCTSVDTVRLGADNGDMARSGETDG